MLGRRRCLFKADHNIHVAMIVAGAAGNSGGVSTTWQGFSASHFLVILSDCGHEAGMLGAGKHGNFKL